MEYDGASPTLPVPPEYGKKILCIARFSPQKRFDLFLETARLLPEYAFVWIGNQRDPGVTPENVFCLGNIANAGDYNRGAHLFMLPSNYEGLPIVILEAMRFGRPVVASRVGGVAEIVIDGVNGYTVENDAALFAEKIRCILENEDVYEKFSGNARRMFEERLTLKNMVDGYLEIYREIRGGA
jgi:glycosyltransferase involved in cell wall biosynthesis